jgi:hypothetical protein
LDAGVRHSTAGFEDCFLMPFFEMPSDQHDTDFCAEAEEKVLDDESRGGRPCSKLSSLVDRIPFGVF